MTVGLVQELQAAASLEAIGIDQRFLKVQRGIQQALGDDEALRLVLGDLVRWPDPSDNRHPEVEAEAEAIDKAFSAGRLVSEYVIEDRGEA